MKQSSDFDRLANDYSFWEYTCSKARYKRVLDFLPDGVACALDLGCGSGSLTIEMSMRARRVIGIDSSPQMLSMAERKRVSTHKTNVQFLQADLQDLPFTRPSFDFIASYGVLHHVDINRALETQRRLIRPHGRVMVFDYVTSSFQQHASPAWHIRQAIKSSPTYLSSYGFMAMWRIIRFRVSKAWLAHVCADKLLTSEAFQNAFDRYFPNAVFRLYEGSAAAYWEAG